MTGERGRPPLRLGTTWPWIATASGAGCVVAIFLVERALPPGPGRNALLAGLLFLVVLAGAWALFRSRRRPPLS